MAGVLSVFIRGAAAVPRKEIARMLIKLYFNDPPGGR